MTEFDRVWSEHKLNQQRCKLEASQYVYRYLPELKTAQMGLVIDVGCGSGEFLALCKSMGHDVLGIDAPRNISQMGCDYIDVASERLEELGIPVRRTPFIELLNSDGNTYSNQACCVNFRGSIEQCLSEFLIGVPHVYHHDCKSLDWDKETADDAICSLIGWAQDSLEKHGVLMIAANGTKSTNEWYSDTICGHANDSDLELEYQEGFLIHRWVKK